ncbi:hypothetical protein JCM8547_004007 [Rhodosporidiobolus lusitaniae]
MAPRVVIVAIGGPTCGGKTTLAKHIARILPSSLSLFQVRSLPLLHPTLDTFADLALLPVVRGQDDFAPPSELVPIDPVHGWQDWDDAAGAIRWDKQREALKCLRETGTFPAAHSSHDLLNAQHLAPVPISEGVVEEWRRRFEELIEREEEKPIFVIADGFLLLVDPESVRQFDVRLFVREDYATLKRRREERHGYHTAEGSLWKDPPNYWDLCVWPAYLRAHAPLFVNNDVEHGQPNPDAIEGVQVFEANEMGMEKMVVGACEELWRYVKEGRTAEGWRKP